MIFKPLFLLSIHSNENHPAGSRRCDRLFKQADRNETFQQELFRRRMRNDWGNIVVLCLLNVTLVQAQPPDVSQKKPVAQNENPPAHGTVLVTKEMTGPYRPRNQPKLEQVISGIIDRTNGFRKAEKLEPLTTSDILQKTAQEFADYMAKTGKYGHEADERTPSQRVEANHYEICFVGENIAMQYREDGFATGPLMKAFFQGWKNSPPHRANLLQPGVTETGVGIAQSRETGAYFAVQLVGRPLSQAILFQVQNDTGKDLTYYVGEEQFTIRDRYTQRHRLCSPEKLKLQSAGKEIISTPVVDGADFVVHTRDNTLVIDQKASQKDVP